MSTNRLQKIARTAQVGSFRNPRTLGPMAYPPSVSATSDLPAGITRDYIAAAQGSPSNTLASDHPFTFSGGHPYINPNVGGLCFPALTEGAGHGGNIDNSGRAARTWRAHFMTDAAVVSVRLLGYLAPYRFLVNGQFISLTPTRTQNAGGAQYITLDFGSREPLGRKITVEGNSSAAFWSAHVGATDSIWPIDKGDLIKVGVVGDSISTGTGATLLNDAFPIVLGDYLGADDIWSMGIGGTGYLNAGTTWKFGDHSVDWTAQTDWDLLIFTGGNNDGGHTAAELATAVNALLVEARAALPDIPFVVFGPTTSPTANNLAVEAGIQSAVAALADPLIAFVPTQAPPVGTPEIFGTGCVGNAKGDGNADHYIGVDGAHPPTEGHLYLGHRRALQVRRAVLGMLPA